MFNLPIWKSICASVENQSEIPISDVLEKEKSYSRVRTLRVRTLRVRTLRHKGCL